MTFRESDSEGRREGALFVYPRPTRQSCGLVNESDVLSRLDMRKFNLQCL